MDTQWGDPFATMLNQTKINMALKKTGLDEGRIHFLSMIMRLVLEEQQQKQHEQQLMRQEQLQQQLLLQKHLMYDEQQQQQQQQQQLMLLQKFANQNQAYMNAPPQQQQQQQQLMFQQNHTYPNNREDNNDGHLAKKRQQFWSTIASLLPSEHQIMREQQLHNDQQQSINGVRESSKGYLGAPEADDIEYYGFDFHNDQQQQQQQQQQEQPMVSPQWRYSNNKRPLKTKYSCPVCKKEFFKLQSVETHMVIVHEALSGELTSDDESSFRSSCDRELVHCWPLDQGEKRSLSRLDDAVTRSNLNLVKRPCLVSASSIAGNYKCQDAYNNGNYHDGIDEVSSDPFVDVVGDDGTEVWNNKDDDDGDDDVFNSTYKPRMSPESSIDSEPMESPTQEDEDEQEPLCEALERRCNIDETQRVQSSGQIEISCHQCKYCQLPFYYFNNYVEHLRVQHNFESQLGAKDTSTPIVPYLHEDYYTSSPLASSYKYEDDHKSHRSQLNEADRYDQQRGDEEEADREDRSGARFIILNCVLCKRFFFSMSQLNEHVKQLHERVAAL